MEKRGAVSEWECCQAEDSYLKSREGRKMHFIGLRASTWSARKQISLEGTIFLL